MFADERTQPTRLSRWSFSRCDWNRTARVWLFARAGLSPSAILANAHESRHSGSLLRACTGSGSADLERRSSSRRLPVDHRSSVRVARTAPAGITAARILVRLDRADARAHLAAMQSQRGAVLCPDRTACRADDDCGALT